jgi:hypothetical protein
VHRNVFTHSAYKNKLTFNVDGAIFDNSGVIPPNTRQRIQQQTNINEVDTLNSSLCDMTVTDVNEFSDDD